MFPGISFKLRSGIGHCLQGFFEVGDDVGNVFSANRHLINASLIQRTADV